MTQGKNKKIVLAILVIILLVEVVFLAKKMTTDRKATDMLKAAEEEQVMITKAVDQLKKTSLESYVADNTIKDQVTKTKKSVDENKTMLENLTHISGEMKKQKSDLITQYDNDSKAIDAMNKKITISKEIATTFDKDPFKGNSLEKGLSVSKVMSEADEKKMSENINSLPKDEQRATLEVAYKDIASQTKTIHTAQSELDKYMNKDDIKEVPSTEEFEKLVAQVDEIKNPEVKKPLMNRTQILRKEIQKEHPDELVDNRKLVALTFDDGPNDGSSVQILDTLKKHDVKATFFVLGNMVENYPDTLKRIADEGHEIGNHSYDHSDLSTLDQASVKKQIDVTNDAVEKITGKRPTMLRPPYGAYNETVTNATDMDIALWNVDTLDWQSRNSDAILGQVKAQPFTQAVVLMHDIHDTSADALENVILYYKDQGYTFVPASELIGQI
ncbi:polysaccharide deacetylase family protein [Vagococcus jeotgali]|uniref:polysaccharide deacetylase family protein n=1 Tax=Vagococcus jeotgali TaxID=3109030 RepID=UPI002DD86FDB|nr:polysaccharide deacetylase family protein [Vagococcus sp. B2T-5]